MKVKSITVIIFFVLTGFILVSIPGAFASDNASDNSCIDCHKTLTPFLEVQKQFNEIRIQHLERNVSCSLECHQDRLMQLATANYQQWSESVHALKGVTCDVCHGGDPKQTTKEKAHTAMKNITDPESPVYYTNVPQTCGKCHSNELASFEKSNHYKKLEALQTAPTCTTCHAPHTFMVLNPEDFRNFCGSCHSVYKNVAPYEIPVQAEYLLGKVNKLKFDIETTREDIFLAKENGTNVTLAEQYSDSALKTVQDLAPMWHEFNLTHFEDSVNSANNEIKMAEDIVKPAPTPTQTTTPSVPGFLSLSGIISLLAVVYLLRKN
jgi:ribosomal protein S27AE